MIMAYGLFPLLMLAFIIGYTKPYPIWETWYFIDVWRQFADGGHWFHSLFIERWGHIHAIPNFVNLIVGSVSCHSMLADAVIAWAVTVAALFVIARQLPRNVLIALGIGSALFTTRLAEIWLNSWDLMWGLSLLQAASIGTCLARPTPRSFVVALAVGATAILTAGQGVAIVAAGLVPLALHAVLQRRAAAYLLIWAAFSFACLRIFESLAGSQTPVSRLLELDPQNVFGLLGLALGPGTLFVNLMLIAAGLAIGYGLRGLRFQRLSREDRFWIYMVSMLLGLVMLLAVNRPGQFLSRYLMFLWIAPAAVVYLIYRCSAGRLAGQAIWSLVCAAWIALNSWASYNFHSTVAGWEPLSRPTVALSRNDPDAVTAEMLQGIAASDVALVAKGLSTMKGMRTNIYCRP